MFCLAWKHETIAQVETLNIVMGFSVGTVFVSLMVHQTLKTCFLSNETILADCCTPKNFSGASGLLQFFRTLGGAVAPVVISLRLFFQ